MATYILQASLCWLGFYLIYRLLLSNVTYFQLNRWFLLVTLACGLIIPLIDPFPAVEAGGSALVSNYIDPIVIGSNNGSVNADAIGRSGDWSWQQIVLRVYVLGIVIAFVHFIYGLISLFRLYLTAEKSYHKGYKLALTQSEHLPFSFFNVIFWSRHHQVSADDEQQIIRHEVAHIKGYHSLDVLFLEILSILMWCSPLVYLYRRSLRATHEYLADAAVLQTIRVKKYGHLLIRQSQSGPQIALANHFIHSQLKKRFMMMKKRKSKRQVLSRYLLLVPMMFLMTYLFSKNYSTNDSKVVDKLELSGDVFGEVDEMPRYPGCEELTDVEARSGCSTKKMFGFIFENLKYPAAAKKAGVEGTIVLSFVVEADGSLTNIEVVKDIGSGCGEATVALLEAMPNWIPGKKDGKAVPVEMKLPFKFKLDSDKPATRADAESNPDQFPIFPNCAAEGSSYKEQAICSKQSIVQHIIENVKYPKDAKEQEVEGMVVVSFVVGTEGDVRDIKIEKSLFPSCDAHVIEIIERMNDLDEPWLAGKKDGKAVATVLTLPVKFKFTDDDAKDKLSVAELKLSSFKASPNPTDGMLEVSFRGEAKATQVVIMDLNGRIVFSQELHDFDGQYTQQINLDKAAKGTMVLQISQGERVFTQKIILQ